MKNESLKEWWFGFIRTDLFFISAIWANLLTNLGEIGEQIRPNCRLKHNVWENRWWCMNVYWEIKKQVVDNTWPPAFIFPVCYSDSFSGRSICLFTFGKHLFFLCHSSFLFSYSCCRYSRKLSAIVKLFVREFTIYHADFYRSIRICTASDEFGAR